MTIRRLPLLHAGRARPHRPRRTKSGGQCRARSHRALIVFGVRCKSVSPPPHLRLVLHAGLSGLSWRHHVTQARR